MALAAYDRLDPGAARVINVGSGLCMLIVAPNRELESKVLKLLRSEVAAAWADISHAFRDFTSLRMS